MHAPRQTDTPPGKQSPRITRADAVLIAVLAAAFVAWVAFIAVRMRLSDRNIRIIQTNHEAAAYRINLNSAGAAELQILPAIGPKRANRIVAWRRRHGHIRSLEQLRQAAGISHRDVERIRPLVTLGDDPAPAARERRPE